MKRAFTLIEMVFVIVVIGILAKFGTNLLRTVYESYTASTTNNTLQVETELSLKQISNRLQYRIKESVIARTAPGGAFTALSSTLAGTNYTILEWVGYDIDGLQGVTNGAWNIPTWSGFIDVDTAAAVAAGNYLESPGSDTVLADGVIQAVRPIGSATTIADAAVFFTGANSDVQTDYGWDGTAQNTQNTTAAHRIASVAGQVTQLRDGTLPASGFAGTDIYENYKLAWTAYAIRLQDGDGDGLVDDLVLYYDYQPWEGDTLANATSVLLLRDVDTFKFTGIGDTIKLQICVNEENRLGGGAYALCKETAIF